MKSAEILVIDDEQMIRFAFEQFLHDEGYQPILARNGQEGLSLAEQHCPPIVFLDYRLPDADGLSLMPSILEVCPKAAIIFMTAFGDMEVAIQAMHNQAYEYLTKPLDLDSIRSLIQRILEDKSETGMPTGPPPEAKPSVKAHHMVGASPAMQEVYKMIGLASAQEVSVLISGESGVGKELVARAIHANSSRAGHPFVAVNCGALPDTLLESELFGYEKGAFTGAEHQKPGKFEMAHQGTLFLDEIGELPFQLQVKLLRVLQFQEFERVGGTVPVRTRARLLAATNKDLAEESSRGTFRKDLFYRLRLVDIQVPPLRERREDIPLLVEHFVSLANAEMGKAVQGVSPDALEFLSSLDWPGNVRELEHALKQAIVMSRDSLLHKNLFSPFGAENKIYQTTLEPETALEGAVKTYLEHLLQNEPGEPFDTIIAKVEKTLLHEVLQKTGGNQLKTAQILGMNRSTLRKKAKRYFGLSDK